jgi:2-methylisocitrate lyase-like PEP mutase family enzyme
MSQSDYTSRRNLFKELHQSGCFVIPNPWDVGSARYLRHLGFRALATTSAGFAFSRGLADAEVPRDEMLQHIREIVAAVDLPVNADFESGYAPDPEALATNVQLCIETGVAGLSIEDSTGDTRKPLYDVSQAVDRIKAARAAIDHSNTGVLLTARAECYLVRHPDPLKESIRRLQAYAAAGADVLYAPGVHHPDEVRTIAAEIAPKPMNLLVSWSTMTSVNEFADLGVRRISLGSALARVAWGGFMKAAQTLSKGRLTGLDGMVPFPEINNFFRQG